MDITCRFSKTDLARWTAKALITALSAALLAPATATSVVHAQDVTPPVPAPPRPPIVGFADTHVHQFANLAFGGLEVWGSPVDPSLDPNAFLGSPDDARRRALPNSDYIFVSNSEVDGYVSVADVPVRNTPLATSCDNGSCWPQCPAGSGVQGNACWKVTIHGDNGGADLLAYAVEEVDHHGILGFPDMDGWPAWNIVTAQQVYWEWLKRAHDHGMKLMVMLAVNNSVLCGVGVHKTAFGCGDDGSVDRQIQGAKNLEQYIDAVEGGPGMGFYRIVYSAAEARQAIQDGKLAVVLGTEVDTEWGCKVDEPSCTDDLILQHVQEYRDRGIRVVFPVHVIDNGFGGSAAYTGLFEVDSFLVNGKFYDLNTTCPAGIEWRSGLRKDIGDVQQTVNDTLVGLAVAAPLLPAALAVALPILGPIVGGLIAASPQLSLVAPLLSSFLPLSGPLLTVLPVATVALIALIEALPGEAGSAPAPNCNQRTLTHAGETLVNALMDQRMIIDIDHTDTATLERILDVAQTRHYPGIESGHTGLVGASNTQAEATPILAARGQTFKYEASGRHEGNKTDDHVNRILNLGGTLSLGLGAGSRAAIKEHSSGQVPFDCGKSSDGFAQAYLYATRDLHVSAMSFGSDLNGFSGWPAPRFGSQHCGQGTPTGGAPDTSPTYNPAGTRLVYDSSLTDYFGAPLDQYRFGNRTWDFNVDGFAHVGLYPDFIADLQAHGVTHDDLAPLFNGVEAYVRMWEKVDDNEAPTVRCGTVGGSWHASDVAVPCIAFDPGWGLQDGADASFSVSTAVPDGVETSNASTATHPDVCDLDPVKKCTAVVPVAGIKVDKKAPTILLTTPAAGTPVYTVNQSVIADYSCSDGGSGVATCAGPVAAGAALDTSVGTHAFTVLSSDGVNNGSSQSHPYNAAFGICPLYDSTTAKKAGSTIPIKLQLCDAAGRNLSSSSIVVHATEVTLTSTNAPAALDDAGNANPDFDFRYDAGLGGYVFNVSTKGYRTGTYALSFTANGDPTIHQTTFAVR
jgi:microsomal dipeptidase-like Zn-dependent dipeptidase